jgi:hypothetical protein
MVQTVARTRFGPETFEVNTGQTITGGMLVEPDGTTGKIKPAVVDSAKWLGVALYDAQPAGTTGATSTWGFATVDASVPQKDVAVAWHGTVKLKAAEAIGFGEVVYCAANGEIQNATTTGRAVGQCVQTGGIASGAYGLIRLF